MLRIVGALSPRWRDGEDTYDWRPAPGFVHRWGHTARSCLGDYSGVTYSGMPPFMGCLDSGTHHCWLGGAVVEGQPSGWETGPPVTLNSNVEEQVSGDAVHFTYYARDTRRKLAGLLTAARFRVQINSRERAVSWLDLTVLPRTNFLRGSIVLGCPFWPIPGSQVILYVTRQRWNDDSGWNDVRGSWYEGWEASPVFGEDNFANIWNNAGRALDAQIPGGFAPSVRFGTVVALDKFRFEFRWKLAQGDTEKFLHDAIKHELGPEAADGIDYSMEFVWAAPKCTRGHYQDGNDCIACPAEHYIEIDGAVKSASSTGGLQHPCKKCQGCDFGCEYW